MRRGKPQQQYYRPGSGPLRKSGHGFDDNESEYNSSDSSRQASVKVSASDRMSRIKNDVMNRENEIQATSGKYHIVCNFGIIRQLCCYLHSYLFAYFCVFINISLSLVCKQIVAKACCKLCCKIFCNLKRLNIMKFYDLHSMLGFKYE